MVNPNMFTFTRIIGIPFFIILLESNLSRWIPAVAFFLLAATDFFDGRIARKNRQVSKTGAILDPLADKLLVSAALIFLTGNGVDAWIAYVIIAREFIITALRLIAPPIIHAHTLGKLKTTVQVIAIIATIMLIPYYWWLMLFATLLTIISGMHYLWLARTNIKL